MRYGNFCIARETSDLAYRWDSERVEKKEIFNDGNNVEYIQGRINVYYTPRCSVGVFSDTPRDGGCVRVV